MAGRPGTRRKTQSQVASYMRGVRRYQVTKRENRRLQRQMRFRATKSYISRSGSMIFKPRQNYKFTYSQAITLTPGVGGVAANTFRGNSLFDPDATGVGGSQPRYFDTLCGSNSSNAPYGSYCVNAFKCAVFARNTGASHCFVSISVFRASTSSAPASLDECRERPDTILRVVSPLGSGTAVSKIEAYASNKSVLGFSDLMDSQNAVATYNASPADAVSCVVQAWNPDGSSAINIKCDVKMTYYATLFILNDVADS